MLVETTENHSCPMAGQNSPGQGSWKIPDRGDTPAAPVSDALRLLQALGQPHPAFYHRSCMRSHLADRLEIAAVVYARNRWPGRGSGTAAKQNGRGQYSQKTESS